MPKKARIVSYSGEDIKRMIARGESKTNWRRVKATSQAEVERLADEEEGSLHADWESTVEIGVPEPEQAVHIRLDKGVLSWFKAYGPGYQTRINAVLRAFVAARRRAEPEV
jgi:uncharacterized protein (DUF4415 family)